jgi:predicted unusual protein kinase regulating ubiquinone biosynthesis (AarF/ABC1/UbiB family)
MKFSPRFLKRYKDIGMLVLKYSRTDMISKFGHDHEQIDGNGEARELSNDLERLGPTFVKLGQLLSSRADLLPEPYLRSLYRLQDQVKPFPYQDVEFIIERELRAKITKLFSQFNPEPLAAASLGQVHCACLHDGRPVAVKVQRPNITNEIAVDFAALRELARFMDRHTKFGQRYRFVQILEEFENTIAHELDYRREAANMVTLSNNLREFERIRIPLPVLDYTTHKVLTMEYIEGTKITDLSPLVLIDIEGAALAEELFRAYLHQVLLDGTFHADPHPGNVFLTENNQIALLDLGMVGHTTPRLQEELLKLLLAVSEGQSDEAAGIAIRISEPRSRFNELDFRHKIGQIVAEQRNSTLRQIDIGRVILEVGRSAADTGLYAPTELSLLGKTLLQLDQIGRILFPEFDPNESIRRNAAEILNQRLKSAFTQGKAASTLLEARQFLGALPWRLNKILDAVGNAELNVKVKPVETEFLIESAQKVANRITTGLILSALIVGAALLMHVRTSFELFGYPGLAIICFLLAAVGGLWLVCNILWQDHKTKLKTRA